MSEDTAKYSVDVLHRLKTWPVAWAFGDGSYYATLVRDAVGHVKYVEQENAKLRGQRDELRTLALSLTRDNPDMRAVVEKRIAEILGEGDGRV